VDIAEQVSEGKCQRTRDADVRGAGASGPVDGVEKQEEAGNEEAGKFFQFQLDFR
jgi:hypothetical protein